MDLCDSPLVNVRDAKAMGNSTLLKFWAKTVCYQNIKHGPTNTGKYDANNITTDKDT